MRGVCGVADQHELAVMPSLTQHTIEIEPCRATQVARVAHQAVAVEVFAEDALAERNRAFRIDVLESGRAPGFLTGFDDESAGVLIEAIGVELEPAPGRLFESEGECIELATRSEPDVAALAHVDVGLEGLGIPAADRTVD